jgi:ribonuclease BN (tRNA processing enzyme)
MNPPIVRPLQVLALGTGDAFASNDYHCALVLTGGATLCLVDCPDPIHRILDERSGALGQPLGGADINDIVLTHLHGDHCNGLESLLFYRRFVSNSPPLTIHTIPEVAQALWPQKLEVAMGHTFIPEIGLDQRFAPEEFFRLRVVEAGQPFDVGDLRFVARRTRHSVPTFGFRVSQGGRTFGYSCDTTFDPGHIAFLSEADLIFHDCSESVIHTRYADLLTVEAGVRERLHILHLADSFDRAASQLAVVEPGRLYTV